MWYPGANILAGFLALTAGHVQGVIDEAVLVQTRRDEAPVNNEGLKKALDTPRLPSSCRLPVDAYPKPRGLEEHRVWANSLGPSLMEATGSAKLSRGAADREWWKVPAGFRMCDNKDNLHNLRPLLIPSKKLAFCYVSKVACTQMKDLFNQLNGFTDDIWRGTGFGMSYLLSTTSHAFQWLDMKTVNKANGWKFAMFVRDPALRYLSAYGSCCVRNDQTGLWEHEGVACCGDLARTANHTVIAEQFAERVKQDVLHGIPFDDMHWGSHLDHIRHCGFENFKPRNLDFVGVLAGDVNGQVKEMLKLVNITRDGLVDRLFPIGGIAGHRSSALLQVPASYADSRTLEAVKSLYAEDYKAFPQIGCAFSSKAERTPSDAP